MPTPIFPANSPIAILPLAFALNKGNPEILFML